MLYTPKNSALACTNCVRTAVDCCYGYAPSREVFNVRPCGERERESVLVWERDIENGLKGVSLSVWGREGVSQLIQEWCIEVATMIHQTHT